ncbi:hypothetical protein MHYP_G00097590 [Metynnis hypsauchen]
MQRKLDAIAVKFSNIPHMVSGTTEHETDPSLSSSGQDITLQSKWGMASMADHCPLLPSRVYIKAESEQHPRPPNGSHRSLFNGTSHHWSYNFN